MKLLLCDDEKIILQGMQFILDWNSFGFNEILTASSGEIALNTIIENNPDLVIIDIHMPKLTGLEVIAKSREKGFYGHFVIVSGYSDFAYAQKAISLDVVSYLCKPVDSYELESTVKGIIEKINKTTYKSDMIDNYTDVAIRDYLSNTVENYDPNSIPYGLENINHFQVLAFEKFYKTEFNTNDSFKEILNISAEIKYSSFRKDNLNVVILLGKRSIELISHSTKYYNDYFQKNSLLDNTFIYFGEEVRGLEALAQSFKDVKLLVYERFFCSKNDHFLMFNHIRTKTFNISTLSNHTEIYSKKLFNVVQSCDLNTLNEFLENLKEEIKSNGVTEEKSKIFFTDLYMMTKNKINQYYTDISTLSYNYSNIATEIHNKSFLYEIIEYFEIQFTAVINSINQHTKDKIMYDILDYIDKNFNSNLKLKTVAEHFNYNSSYFGKLFTKSFDCTFNKYLEMVRIEKSKILLENENLKVYQICEGVGYNNVDYFHKKFKSIVGVSPLEYRKQILNK